MNIPLPQGRVLSLDEAPVVMGIVNVTPDSFSDAGLHFDRVLAIEAGLRMVDEGAAIVDVGGESTRPGSDEVTVEVEMGRVVPVIEGIRARSSAVISVDTRKAAVADAAIEAGADIVNDVSGLRFDASIADVVRERGAALILMHMRGEPKTMQETISFDDLVGEISLELAQSRDLAVARGVREDAILVDPGIGFGKTFDHNLEILARAAEFARIAPVVIAASRKGFIGKLTGRPSGAPRAAGSLAAVAAAKLAGAAIVRVHDVAQTVDFLRVFNAIRNYA